MVSSTSVYREGRDPVGSASWLCSALCHADLSYLAAHCGCVRGIFLFVHPFVQPLVRSVFIVPFQCGAQGCHS